VRAAVAGVNGTAAMQSSARLCTYRSPLLHRLCTLFLFCCHDCGRSECLWCLMRCAVLVCSLLRRDVCMSVTSVCELVNVLSVCACVYQASAFTPCSVYSTTLYLGIIPLPAMSFACGAMFTTRPLHGHGVSKYCCRDPFVVGCATLIHQRVVSSATVDMCDTRCFSLVRGTTCRGYSVKLWLFSAWHVLQNMSLTCHESCLRHCLQITVTMQL
jgi:hypothetical protein